MPFLTAVQQGSDPVRPTTPVPEFGLILLAPTLCHLSGLSSNIAPHKHPRSPGRMMVTAKSVDLNKQGICEESRRIYDAAVAK